jgi:hypothetical protein
MSPPDGKKLLTRDQLSEERLFFSEINPRRRRVNQIAFQIKALQMESSLGIKSPASDLSALAKWLTFEATPTDLRDLADAIEHFSDELRVDARRANIVQSWFAAVALKESEPTLAEVKECFLSYFHTQMLPTDYSIRKTLKLLGLTLRKAKRGRPPRAGSKKRRPRWARYVKPYAVFKTAKIGNSRRVEQ